MLIKFKILQEFIKIGNVENCILYQIRVVKKTNFLKSIKLKLQLQWIKNYSYQNTRTLFNKQEIQIKVNKLLRKSKMFYLNFPDYFIEEKYILKA